MALYVGLDVSLRTISVFIVEAKGKVVWEGKVLCEEPALIAALAPYRKKIKYVGIEAGPLSEWLFGILTECHFNAVCIESRHAHRFLSSRPNKTDRNDARGIADMMRLGHFKAVHVKSRASQLLRTMLAARKTFVDHMLEIEQAIRGFLKVYGLKLGQVHRYNFSAKVKAMVADTPELAAAIAPLLEARDMMRKKKKEIDRELEKRARQDAVCQRLMTIPGVGPIISLAYKATIDDPARFKSSRAVPAHLGLTPRVYQSGEMDRSGHISKCGDRLLRHCLYEAVNAHMRVTRKCSALRAWGVKLAKRVGSKKACVAVARKLAIIMHRMWREDITSNSARHRNAWQRRKQRSRPSAQPRTRGPASPRQSLCPVESGHVQLERTAEPSGPHRGAAFRGRRRTEARARLEWTTTEDSDGESDTVPMSNLLLVCC